MNSRTLERIVPILIKVGLWSVLFMPLVVSSSLLFPFITGKNFLFRIIIEIIAALWIGAMVAWPKYRLKLTPLVKLSFVFILIVFLADLFGPNPFRSFFSNYERMEGFMMIFHLWVYFLILVSVLKTRKDWLTFFHISLVASFLVGFVGILQKLGYTVSIQGGYRIDSTIGNPSYLAAYLSFHVWFLVIFLKQFWQKMALRLFYFSAILFELSIIFFTATRGVMVALTAGSILLLTFVAFFWDRLFPDNRSFRRWIVALTVVFFLLPVIFWQIRGASFIQKNQVLNRLASISLEDTTTKSRFSIWNMSWQAVQERPILGWGQENYYLVFQKYFDPSLYSSEPWFDRSHNIIFDWLVHTGVLGFLAFFSLLGTTFYLLFWRGVIKRGVDPWVGGVLGIAFISYLIQNFFVFDNLNTYLLFFAFLAFTNHLTSGDDAGAEKAPARTDAPKYFYASAGMMLVLVASVFYTLHIKPVRAGQALIDALQIQRAQNVTVDHMIAAFERALAYNTFGNTEIIEQLANITRTIPTDQRFSQEDQLRFVRFALEAMRPLVQHPAKDIKHMLFFASVLSSAGHFDPAFGQEAEQVLQEAVTLSPTKQQIYFELGQLYLRQGRFDEAVATLRTAAEVDPTFQQALVNYLIAGVIASRQDVLDEVRGQLVLNRLTEENLERVGLIYRDVNDLDFSVKVYEWLVPFAPHNTQHRATYAAILGELGHYDRAIEEARIAAEMDPSFAAEAEVFIELMEERKAAQ